MSDELKPCPFCSKHAERKENDYKVACSDEAVEEVLQRGGIRPLATVESTYPRVERLARE